MTPPPGDGTEPGQARGDDAPWLGRPRKWTDRGDAGPSRLAIGDRRHVVVVGPCASGKSTLVAGLRRLGYEATVSGQEHSEIPTLWRRVAPDVLIALDVDLPTLRRRRGDDWPEWLFLLQRRRLHRARLAADLLLDTTTLDADTVLARVASLLRARSRAAG